MSFYDTKERSVMLTDVDWMMKRRIDDEENAAPVDAAMMTYRMMHLSKSMKSKITMLILNPKFA